MQATGPCCTSKSSQLALVATTSTCSIAWSWSSCVFFGVLIVRTWFVTVRAWFDRLGGSGGGRREVQRSHSIDSGHGALSLSQAGALSLFSMASPVWILCPFAGNGQSRNRPLLHVEVSKVRLRDCPLTPKVRSRGCRFRILFGPVAGRNCRLALAECPVAYGGQHTRMTQELCYFYCAVPLYSCLIVPVFPAALGPAGR